MLLFDGEYCTSADSKNGLHQGNESNLFHCKEAVQLLYILSYLVLKTLNLTFTSAVIKIFNMKKSFLLPNIDIYRTLSWEQNKNEAPILPHFLDPYFTHLSS